MIFFLRTCVLAAGAALVPGCGDAGDGSSDASGTAETVDPTTGEATTSEGSTSEPSTGEATTAGTTGSSSDPTGPTTTTATGPTTATATEPTTSATETGGGPDVPCGDMLVCDCAVEYCNVVVPGVPDSDPTYSCIDLPAACESDPTCACLMEEGVPGDCEELPEGGLRVTQYAP